MNKKKDKGYKPLMQWRSFIIAGILSFLLGMFFFGLIIVAGVYF